MYRIPPTLAVDIDYTERLIKKFKAGEITAAELKSKRVPMGIYEQRKDRHHMLRLRCTGGLITPTQLAVVARVAHQLSASHIHLTTRQELQIHNVDIDDAPDALRRLAAHGLSTQGGGGNTVRNMMAHDRSGLTERAAFDVYPYVEELTSRLIAEADSFNMPRKYKVAFDINVEEANASLVADLGLQARVRDGERGFRVLIAGSTASNPHVGWEVFDFLPERDLYRAAKALKNWFLRHGNRRNRHKARMRYVFYRLGEEEAKRLYYEEFDTLKADPALDFVAPATVMAPERHDPAFAPLADESAEFLLWKKRYAHRAPDGLWYAYIPLPHGNGSPELFAEIAEHLAAYGDDVIRLTKKEQMQVRGISEAYLPNVYRFFRRVGVWQVDEPPVVAALTSCTGADTCRLGICMPKGAIDAIKRRLLASDLDLDAIPDFELRMNGCPNTCANATWADLGLSGRLGRTGDDAYPAYTVLLPTAGRTQLNRAVGYIAAKYLPAFVEDYLRDVIAEQKQFASYSDYVQQRGADFVRQLLAEKYKTVAPYAEAPDFYFDYGDDTKFSLVKYGQAECSAGLFDIIDIDQRTIADKRRALETAADADQQKILEEMVLAEARMLLVTRGLDPRTDEEVYRGFLSEFVDAGIVPARFRPLIEARRDGRSLLVFKADALALADLLDELYKGMDDNLQFKKAEEAASAAPAPQEEAKEEPAAPTVKKDFRGVACPMNFVKTKIALAPLPSGALLEILLDDGQPIANVPGSVRGEGHTVVKTEKIDGYWRVVIRKK